MPTLYLLHLDAAHLGDPTFVQSLAQQFSRSAAGEPASLLLHGSGEKLERTLEAQGVFPDRVDGVLQVDDEHRPLVERAVREVNQELVGTLTDEVVPTVGVQGVDRSLLQRGADDALVAPKVGWLEALLKQRVLPVVSTLAPVPSGGDGRAGVTEVPAAAALRALAEGLSSAYEPVAVFFSSSGRAGLTGADAPPESVAPDAVTDADVPDPDAVRRVAASGLPVLITSVAGFFDDDGPRGTWVRSE